MDHSDRLIDNCKVLDTIGFTLVNNLDIRPYKADFNVGAKYDCSKARTYYGKHNRLGDRVALYEMHHTTDGYIVPVVKALHKATDHIGGVSIFGLKR